MRSLFLLFLVLIPLRLISAQEEDTEYKYWMTLGVGIINTTLDLSYSFSIEDYFYKAGYLRRGGLFTTTGRDGYLYNAVNISIGKRLQSEWFQASLFTGPSYLFGERKAAGESNVRFNSIGLESDFTGRV